MNKKHFTKRCVRAGARGARERGEVRAGRVLPAARRRQCGGLCPRALTGSCLRRGGARVTEGAGAAAGPGKRLGHGIRGQGRLRPRQSRRGGGARSRLPAHQGAAARRLVRARPGAAGWAAAGSGSRGRCGRRGVSVLCCSVCRLWRECARRTLRTRQRIAWVSALEPGPTESHSLVRALARELEVRGREGRPEGARAQCPHLNT